MRFILDTFEFWLIAPLIRFVYWLVFLIVNISIRSLWSNVLCFTCLCLCFCIVFLSHTFFSFFNDLIVLAVANSIWDGMTFMHFLPAPRR